MALPSKGLLARCFTEASESEEPEAAHDNSDASDADLQLMNQESQPSLRRLQTFDPFNQPEELWPSYYGHSAASTAPVPRLSSPASAQCAQTGMQVQGGHHPPVAAPGSVMQGAGLGGGSMLGASMQQGGTMQPAGMQMQMMPQGFVPAMMPQGGQIMQQTGQGSQVQQGSQMPMMGMAMPTGMPQGIPQGAMIMAMPAPGSYASSNQAMPAPGSYANPGVNFMQPPAVQQAPALSPMAVGSSKSIATSTPSDNPNARAQPQTVTCEEADGVLLVKWTVDARKLKGNDKTVVSPPFEVLSKAKGTFKMMINPTPSKLKGGATFRNSNGKGSVQLKCDTASESALIIRFSIGERGEEPPRGPLEHNFALNGVCRLSKEESEWDFTKVVDETAKTFVVCLELL